MSQIATELDLSDTIKAAKNLLGHKLMYESPEGLTSGYIVETEAYCTSDRASHSYKGKTLSNAPMFEEAGTVYVYFTYGMHHCMNIVTNKEGKGEAVLIRALEPIEGIDLMEKRRNKKVNLTNGPAKVAQSMGINKSINGTSIFKGPIRIENGIKPEVIVEAKRIGISQNKDEFWRFYIKDNKYVSKI